MSRESALPTMLAAWEHGLVNRFLKIGDNGDSSPLQSFEITGDTLAIVFPDAQADGTEAEAAFRTAVRTDRYLYGALRDGSPYAPNDAVPNCFAYLCASLLIDTLLDGAYSGQGQYRDRLRTWLGTSRTMMQLSGIASMWRDLRDWLNDRVADGEDFRPLILPDPRTWRQIGYTRRLSFPTRTDLRFLERVLTGFPRGSADAPGLIRAIESAIDRYGVSWGMETAFREFRDAFRGGGALAGHRFWRLVLRAEAARPSMVPLVAATVEIDFDEDGRPEFRLDGALTADLGSALRSPAVARSANLGTAVQRGLIFFRQVGMARWTAEVDPLQGHVRVAVAQTHAAIVRGTVVEFEQSGDWLLTSQPITARTVDDILTRLHLGRLRRERLFDVAIEGGVHTEGGFLGRPNFLPRVDVENRTVIVRALSEDDAHPTAVHCVEGVLVAATPLQGRYELLVYSDRGEQVPEWSRRIRFYQDARPHRDLRSAAEREPEIIEWTALNRSREPAAAVVRRDWATPPQVMSDLLEAIYASGRSGLTDPDVLDLIHRAGAQSSVWDTLRAIQEAGFLQARRRSNWRGRLWTLAQPRLVAREQAVFLEGATCAVLQEEFRQVATVAGGSPFRSVSRSPWGPPVIGAFDVDASQLASVLGWDVAEPTADPMLVPDQLETSPLLATDHVLVSSWDWDRCRFVTSAVGPSSVSITRWIHPGGRDHDQYRVQSLSGETRHATRVAAILQGHATAGVPLFAVKDDALVRTAAEGALPVEIAQWLRARAGEGGGPTADGRYTYPVGDVSIGALARALPNCLARITAAVMQPDHATEQTDGAAVLRSRRSGGRVRLYWSAGRVRAA